MPSLCSIEMQCTSLRVPVTPFISSRNLGTTNSEMPFTPSGASGAREDEMDDVVRQIVLAVGDEDLLAEDPVAAISLRHGARAHGGKVRTGLRLGQVHGAGPFTTNEPRQVGVLQLMRT